MVYNYIKSEWEVFMLLANYVIKRSGSKEPFNNQKIRKAILKNFMSESRAISESNLSDILFGVLKNLDGKEEITVEYVQDIVEKTLMQMGYFDEAKSYILYRQKRAELRDIRSQIEKNIKAPWIKDILLNIQKEYSYENYPLKSLLDRFLNLLKDNMNDDEKINLLIQASAELTSKQSPLWENISARILLAKLKNDIFIQQKSLKINSLYKKIEYLTDKGLYGKYILQSYSAAEIDKAETFICIDRDKLFNFSGLDLLINRYLIRDHYGTVIETPQEMFIGIALHLAMNEKQDRMLWVKKFYDMLSKLEVTMATPTLANSRKPLHQLSSCFIDTVPDDLKGIFRSIDNFAQISKYGGGMGLYFGKVRAAGSDIRGFKGASGGMIRWVRIVNDTAVAVDQLGVRAGSAAVYLDVWHRDIPEFLQLRTNNGDERTKAHDLFPAICYPDLFWKMVKENIEQDWHLMCPHEIMKVKGYCLEDYYGDEWEKRYWECVEEPLIEKRVIKLKDLVRLIIKSAVESGTPFTFNRDTVNRANPNSHKGIIYCSNLCTEIAQNMSAISDIDTEISVGGEEIKINTVTKPGNFVVCNLASLSLGKISLEDEAYLRDLVRTAVRALDNVIDLNFYPVPYAEINNKEYRSIGLGVSGYHHMLAKSKIAWESQKHIDFVDNLFEKINFWAIEASSDYAKEKGKYKYFDGSEWASGEYFAKRNYNSESWQKLKEKVQKDGIRNAYLLAIAPTASTSIISGTTAGIDPIMQKYFLEEKRGSMLPRVAPELNKKTYWYYKNAYHIKQEWSIKACGARQRHIDQAQSMNLYITNEYTMREVLNLYLSAWENGVKTIYYVRSKSLEVEECESCSS